MSDFDVGEPVRLSTTFAVDDVVTDPTTVRATVVGSNGVATTYTYPDDVTKDAVGEYHVDVTPAAAGWWRYYWVGTGVCAVTQQGEFYVRALPG